jgi:hypothetical protein
VIGVALLTLGIVNPVDTCEFICVIVLVTLFKFKEADPLDAFVLPKIITGKLLLVVTVCAVCVVALVMFLSEEKLTLPTLTAFIGTPFLNKYRALFLNVALMSGLA